MDAPKFDIKSKYAPITPRAFEPVRRLESAVYDLSTLEFDIRDLYKFAFGFNAPPFPLGDIQGFVPNNKFSRIGTALFGRDKYGVEVFAPVTLLSEWSGTEYFLPYSTVALSFRKDIVKTKLPGRKGTIKELISEGDIEFTVRGIAIDRENEIPEGDLEMLRLLKEENKAIRIKNVVTDFFLSDSDSVVLEKMHLPDMKGIGRAQAYEMTLTEDNPLELIIE